MKTHSGKKKKYPHTPDFINENLKIKSGEKKLNNPIHLIYISYLGSIKNLVGSVKIWPSCIPGLAPMSTLCSIFLGRRMGWDDIKYHQVWSSMINYDQVWSSIKFDQLWSSIKFDQQWSSIKYDQLWSSIEYEIKYNHVWWDEIRPIINIVIINLGRMLCWYKKGMVTK